MIAAGLRNPAPAEASILDRLRAETRAEHEAIEVAMDWERRVSTIDGYKNLLARIYGFHAVWEPILAVAVSDPAFFDPRRKLALLSADLAHLGLTPSDLAALPRPRIAPPTTAPDALGAMYVIEGSTLGGQLIARRVSETLGLVRGCGCSYHLAYGLSAGAMWRAFRQRLLDASGPGADDAMVMAAKRTFSEMGAWLAQPRRRSSV